MFGKPIGFWALLGLGVMVVLGAIGTPKAAPAPAGAGGVGDWTYGTIPPSAPMPMKPSDSWQQAASRNGHTGAMGQRRMPLAGP